jgi:hypothetical protein
MDLEVDLVADLNAQDDDGLGWSLIADARDPDRVRPGAMLLAGNPQGRAVVRSWPLMTTARSISRSCRGRSRRTVTSSAGLSRDVAPDSVA